MEARVVNKELLEFEKNKPSLLESNFLVYKEEEEECKTVRMKTRKKKKRGDMHGKEEGKQRTMTTFPTSQVLGKVKDFLGVIAEANEKLRLSTQESSRVNLDIEVLNGTEKEYIEMDLLLGLTDLQTPEAITAAEAAIGSSCQYLPLFDENSSSDCEENSDEASDHITADTCLYNDQTPEPDLDDSSSTSRSKKYRKITELN